MSLDPVRWIVFLLVVSGFIAILWTLLPDQLLRWSCRHC